MFAIPCECDDGFSIIVNLTISTTPRDLVTEISRFRNAQLSCVYAEPNNLCVALVNESGNVQSLLCPDVSVKKCLDAGTKIMIFGCNGYLREESSSNLIR